MPGVNMPGPQSPMSSTLVNAVRDCQYSKIKMMLESGVSGNFSHGPNLLVAALHIPDPTRRDKMFRFLLHRGVDSCHVDVTSGRDVLSWACALGCTEQVRQILDSALGEVDLSRRDRDGLTALHHATSRGDVHTVRLLVERMEKYRLSVDIPDKQGFTPFLYARRLGFPTIANILVREGQCSVNQFDTTNFKTVEEWDEIGQKERQEEIRSFRYRQRVQSKIRGKPAANVTKLYPPAVQGRLPTITVSPTRRTNAATSPTDRNSPGEDSATSGRPDTGRLNPHNLPSISGASPDFPGAGIIDKSVDTAFALMGFQAKNSLDVRHPDSFVASQLDTSKATEFSSVLDNISSMMVIASDQQSDAFRKVAKPQSPPQPKVHVEIPKSKRKVSTLAILLGGGRNSPRRSSSRSSNRSGGSNTSRKQKKAKS